MGNTASDDQNILNEQKYTLIKSKVESQIYGVVSIQQDNTTGNYVAVQNNVLQDQEIFQNKEQLWGRIKLLQHDSVVSLLDINHKQQNELCSTIYSIQLHFEYIERNLQQELNERIQGNSPFQEGELWYVLTCVIAALGYLKSEDLLHGDIRPTTILIDNDGRLKIMPKQCFETTLNSYGRIFLHQLNNDVYLSPKLIENLKNKVFNPQHNITKSDIYSLGLIVLECAMLVQINDFHDFNQFIVNQQRIDQCLDTISSSYSNDFVNFLSSMLDPEEDARPDTDDLFDHLKNLSQESELQHTDFKIFASLSRYVPEQQIQQEQPFVAQSVQQSLQTPSSEGGTTQSTQDTNFEKIKRSKKCRTDDHDKAKLSKEPLVEGFDPRKTKQYDGNQEKDVNLFYDESMENKKIKRKKAFNTDDHDKATLTSVPQVGGVDPRIEIKKNIQEQTDQEFEEEPNLQPPLRPKKFSFHENDENLKGVITNITGFDPRQNQEVSKNHTDITEQNPFPQKVGDNKLVQSQKPNLEKQQQILANQLQFQLKQQKLLTSQQMFKSNQIESMHQIIDNQQPVQLNNERFQVVSTKIIRVSPEEVPVLSGGLQYGFEQRGVVQQQFTQQPIQGFPQYYHQPLYHVDQIQQFQNKKYSQYERAYQQPLQGYVQQPLQGSIRYQ